MTNADAAIAAPAAPPAPQPGLLERLQENRSGALLTGLIAMLISAVALSQLITVDFSEMVMYNDTGERIASWMVILAGLIVALVTGYAVRITSPKLNTFAMVSAGVLAGVGVHVMVMVAMSTSFIDDTMWSEFPEGTPEYIADSGMGDSLFFSFITPAQGAGCILAGIVAAITVGWGKRD